MRRLQVLGHWFHDAAPSPLPRPQLLVGPWNPEEQRLVLAYLRAGQMLVDFGEPSFCRFACGEPDMGSADLSDGRYVWPAGLAHYIAAHSVQLPRAFVEHAVAQRGVPAPASLPKPGFGLYDPGPWLQFGQERGSVPDLRGFAIPFGEVLDRVAADLGPVPHEAILLCNGSTREVVLLLADGSLERRQLRAGGQPPRRYAGWHEWPLLPAGQRADVATPPAKPGRGESMGEFFGRLRQAQAGPSTPDATRPPE
jgi:hypothetical protein